MSTVQVGQINSTDGSTAITTGADGYVSFAKTQIGGRRNLIINGDQRIDQRNGGSAVTVNSGSSFFAVDRFKGVGESSDGVYTLQQVSDAPDDFTNSLKATVTTADASIGASQQYYIGQFVEGYNVSNLAYGSSSAKSITLSFWVKSSLTGSFGGAITNQSANRHWVYSYTIDSADTWEYKQVVISGDTASAISATNGIGLRVNWSLGTGTLRQKTVGSWQTDGSYYPYSFSGAVDVIATNGATWQITGVQLEVGTVATPFEHRSYGEELALCQRYFCKTFNQETAVGQNQGSVGALSDRGNSSGTVNVMYTFPVSMRATPSVTTYCINAATANWNGNDGNTPVAGIGYQGQNSAWITGTPATVGSGYAIQASADAEL